MCFHFFSGSQNLAFVLAIPLKECPSFCLQTKKSASAYDVEEIESHQEEYFAFLFKILLKT